MMQRLRARSTILYALVLAAAPTCVMASTVIHLEPPVTSSAQSFGQSVVVLANGNFVVTDPEFDSPGLANDGAVHLYRPDGTLISTLGGGTVSAVAGSGGVVPLANGHFVVVSPSWNQYRGAVTWVNGETGLQGMISPENSLVGSSRNDRVGSMGALPLENGNFVVVSPDWSNGAANAKAGAVTLGDGEAGSTVGAVGPANSLVGEFPDDRVGATGTALDQRGVFALENGHYIVGSPGWGRADEGAATWGDGVHGTVGRVSETNSLVGAPGSGDKIGYHVVPLANGHYVIANPYWDSGAEQDVGSILRGDGVAGIAGRIDTHEFLSGSNANDRVGLEVVPLINGNFVVLSPYWGAGASPLGAATWCSGARVTSSALVGSSNSLVGSRAGDFSGASVVALANGNYVVATPFWDNGPMTDAGAVTWANGDEERATVERPRGPVSPATALAGTHADDRIGSAGVFALVNGHYVVASPYWSGEAGTSPRSGASTWLRGDVPSIGAVSGMNSLVGTRMLQEVGSGGVTALANGHYVVLSPRWEPDDPAVALTAQYGAATWANGEFPTTGPIAAENSLVGSQIGSLVGTSAVALADGNFVVVSPYYSYGSLSNAGAITHGDGAIGMHGAVSAENSLVGLHSVDLIGEAPNDSPYAGVFGLEDGRYVVAAPRWNNSAGIVAIAPRSYPSAGPLTSLLSVEGANPFGGRYQVHDYDANARQLIVGQRLQNRVSLLRLSEQTRTVLDPSLPHQVTVGMPVTIRGYVSSEFTQVKGDVRVITDMLEECGQVQVRESEASALLPFECSITFESPGPQVIRAHFLGDELHDGSEAEPFEFTVIDAPGDGIFEDGFE